MTLWNKRNFGPPNPPTKTWVLLSGLVNSLHDECQCGWYFLGQKRNKKTLAGGFKAFFNFAALWKMIQIDLRLFFSNGLVQPPTRNPGKGHGFSCLLLWWPFRLAGGRVLGSSIFWVGCQGVKVCKKTQERDQNLQARWDDYWWFLGGGNSHIFYFSPRILGEDSNPFWRTYFSKGLKLQPPP